MELYIKNCKQYFEGKIVTTDIHLTEGSFCQATSFEKDIPIIPGENLLLAPSFCDLHVHLREPGFSYKETIESGTKAAARGGFTTICSMPNLDPVPDSIEAISLQLELIRKNAVIEVKPYAAITKNEMGLQLSDILELSSYCCGYSDDGKGVQSNKMMLDAMKTIATTGRMLCAHVEDNSLLIPGGVVHQGIAAIKYSLIGMPSETEYMQLRRDLELVKQTGLRYHLCHISTKESVELIRKAKREGLDVTSEVTPHHFAFSDKDIYEDSGRFKMNPPLRAEEDRLAILEGIADGTIDIIATDHAPHSIDEKSLGLSNSAFGTVGLETAFAAANTFLVKEKIISLARMMSMLSDRPRSILKDQTAEGYVLLDTQCEHIVDTNDFISMGCSTPFEGLKLAGKVLLTVMNGKTIYQDGGFFGE